MTHLTNAVQTPTASVNQPWTYKNLDNDLNLQLFQISALNQTSACFGSTLLFLFHKTVLKHQLYTWDILNSKDCLSVLFTTLSFPSLAFFSLLSFSLPALACALGCSLLAGLFSLTHTHGGGGLNEAGLWTGITGTWQRGPNSYTQKSLPYRVHRTRPADRSVHIHTPRTPVNNWKLLKQYITHETKMLKQYEHCSAMQNSQSWC